MKLRDSQLYSCVSSKGDIMRIQHRHESQDLTKVYHGTSPKNPAFEGTPSFKSQYPLHRKREGTWQVLVIMPVQGTPIGARVGAPIGAEIFSVDGEGSIGANDREIGAPI